MIPNDQPGRKEMINRMINTIYGMNDRDDHLTGWESDFIDSILDQFRSKGDLSNKQCEILERIYDKV